MPRFIDADALKSYLNEREYADMYYIEALFGIIDRQPTISPDEVRGVGKWIHFTRKYISGVGDEGVSMIRCSVCDYTQFESSKSSTNYCPSCGAKMEVTSDAE